MSFTFKLCPGFYSCFTKDTTNLQQLYTMSTRAKENQYMRKFANMNGTSYNQNCQRRQQFSMASGPVSNRICGNLLASNITWTTW